MKLLVKSACIAFVLTVIYSVVPFEANCSQIPDNVFRLHIVANSDSKSDQDLKLKVRDEVLKYTYTLFNSAKSKNEAENIISDNLQNINNVAYKTVLDNGYNYPVKAEITNMYFTTRYYENYTLPSGKYDALRITIGSGKGKNWWCVMYPSLCIPSATDMNTLEEELSDSQYSIVSSKGKFEIGFRILEVFNKIIDSFSA